MASPVLYRQWRCLARQISRPRCPHTNSYRHLQTSSSTPPDFAFAFDIDGVLLRDHDPIPGAREALSFLQSQRIPFILLTNGGGSTEDARVKHLAERLNVPLDISMLVQSHTPFAHLEEYKDKTIMVVGGDKDNCRLVAESYGFKSVITPGDVLIEHSAVWPFSHPFVDYYKSFARPLPKPIDVKDPSKSLKIDAIFVYNDPRDWGLDATIILDLLLSREGIFGTLSPKNDDPTLPNRGYQQDGQPPLYYSNPDLWWAAKFHLPRLGQGAFRESLEGLWTAVTGGEKAGVTMNKTVIGKPYQMTYEFAEKKLLAHRQDLFGSSNSSKLKRVYMIGDNPESDIRGGNTFKSPIGTKWSTIMVKTGVYVEGPPAYQPTSIAKNVYDAVRWAINQESSTIDVDKLAD